jgi:hypothetical protein
MFQDKVEKFSSEEKVNLEEKSLAEAWIATIDEGNFFSTVDDISKIRAFTAYNSVQKKQGLSYFYRGVLLDLSKQEVSIYISTHLSASLLSELENIFINLLEKEKEERGKLLEEYLDCDIPSATNLESLLSSITKALAQFVILKNLEDISNLLNEPESVSIDALLIKLVKQASSFEETKAALAISVYEPYFMYNFEKSKKIGCIYSPPGGPENHSLLINFCWLLSNIHKQNSFLILSELEEGSSRRTTEEGGPPLCSAFAIEIISIMKAGYGIQKRGDHLILVSPQEPVLSNFKINDFFLSEIIKKDKSIELNDEIRSIFEKVVAFIKNIKIEESSNPLFLKQILKDLPSPASSSTTSSTSTAEVTLDSNTPEAITSSSSLLVERALQVQADLTSPDSTAQRSESQQTDNSLVLQGNKISRAEQDQNELNESITADPKKHKS